MTSPWKENMSHSKRTSPWVGRETPVTSIVSNDVVYCLLSDIGGGGQKKCHIAGDILFEWPHILLFYDRLLLGPPKGPPIHDSRPFFRDFTNHAIFS